MTPEELAAERASVAHLPKGTPEEKAEMKKRAAVMGAELCGTLKRTAEKEAKMSNTPLQVSQLKKGMRVKLRSGWEADVVKGCDGNTLTAEVFGDFTETGSIYAHDVIAALVGGQWLTVNMDEEQAQFSEEISAFMSIPAKDSQGVTSKSVTKTPPKLDIITDENPLAPEKRIYQSSNHHKQEDPDVQISGFPLSLDKSTYAELRPEMIKAWRQFANGDEPLKNYLIYACKTFAKTSPVFIEYLAYFVEELQGKEDFKKEMSCQQFQSEKEEPSMMNPMILSALDLATKAHTGQLRKGTDIPYITHPSAVGLILSQYGCNAAVIAAGILHDTVEDGDVSLEQIATKFSPEVAALVKGCSEPDKKATWIPRKLHTIEYLRTAPLDVKLVSSADKLHNITSIASDYEEHGVELWKRFKRGREDQEWYYRSVVDALGNDGFDEHPLHVALTEAVDEFFTKAEKKENPPPASSLDGMSERARLLGEELCGNIRRSVLGKDVAE